MLATPAIRRIVGSELYSQKLGFPSRAEEVESAASMQTHNIRIAASFVLIYAFVGFASHILHAESHLRETFHVRHAEETTFYIDVGRNSGLQEGMKLPIFHADALAGPTGAKPIAVLKVLVVADSSAVCEIVGSSEQVRIGDVGFIDPAGKSQDRQSEEPLQMQEHPIPIGLSEGYRQPVEAEPVSVPTSLAQRNTAVRIGFDYDQTKVAGGFRASELGFQVSSDMTHIAGTNWNFTGHWRSRFRETYSGLSGAQLESLSDRIDRTYHIGLYYESPTSSIIAGFGRLSVPGAPSLATIDGGYFGRKINHRVTVGIFGGSTPDPTAWDYNPNQRIAGSFMNIESGDFDRLHFSVAEGIAMTAIRWRAARQFAFFENTISWKRYLWFYNSTEVDAARISPLPGGGSNNAGISFTSSSLRLQPLERLSVGLNHSYLNSLPTFDRNLLGTSLLDKYIFQGLSVDARYELPYRISVFTQVGRAKSIADTKKMWNSIYGVSLADILKSGFHADFRYAKFASSFGQGDYPALSVARNLNNNVQVEFVAGSQSLASDSTTNTSSHFVTSSATWNLGPRYFFETGYTWSRGISMNYQQWNTMFGYRFGTFRPR
jgi:hypothetical protein